ncbi:S8 family serine peptidase [Planomicrobium sp. Y74]|uniref:S8 family serine peptidase n=1 Tax=Planomicrobium sp. Y74 TaxID=2478977 RepID=UPI000EF477B0|nr:S8 family serine peptidase [Planomicrobium sp. Y74]RLQ90976.1 peptidase S8 [Planomicrobium sp. Y74]
MKRILLIVMMLFLIFPAFSSVNANNTVSSTAAVVDEKVWSVLGNAEVAQVIVTFRGDEKPTEAQLSLLEGLGIESAISMQSLPIVGAVATKQQIEQLANNEQVQSIYLNEKLEYFNADANLITGVDKAQQDDSFRKLNGGLPVSGNGIGVVVNDSGVDGTHKDHELGRNLVQNVLGSTNLQSITGVLPVSYTENVPNTDTNSGHGTHVAGTVGGTGALSGGKYEGAAPGADLIGYGSGGALFVLDGIGGFDYAVTHQNEYNIRVITNSWGSSGDFDPNHPINLASKKAYDRGIVVLFAAGNAGPGENTHNPYAKAPWVISVGAGEKDGTLADFSSRGTEGVGGTFELQGKTWTWADEPSIVAPGVDIISTRTVSPLTALAADADAATIEPAYLPYYTTMSGTSMATPHVAGITALLLEADPLLSPDEVKTVLQQTATNMPGYESWEVGAGYVNAYAAIDAVFNSKTYGETLNSEKVFNANVSEETTQETFTVDYTVSVSNQHAFTVEEGVSTVNAKVNAAGLIGETGNPVNLVLIAPDGTEYSSGISLLFATTYDRTVIVNNPQAGEWKAEVRGLHGDALNPIGLAVPETVEGNISFTKVNGITGLTDVAGHPAEPAIAMGVKNRLFDSNAKGQFRPDDKLTRADLATYLVMGAEIRQSLPASPSFTDTDSSVTPYAEAVTAKGAAFRDYSQVSNGVMKTNDNGTFNPKGNVTKAELAYSLVQSLGLQQQAEEFSGDVTVQYKDERVIVKDQDSIPAELKPYVQLALDLNILNAQFSVTQGKYDLEPTVEAVFNPGEQVLRGDFAVAFSRHYEVFFTN